MDAQSGKYDMRGTETDQQALIKNTLSGNYIPEA